MKQVSCWVIFVYRCIRGKVKILLISKNGLNYEPVYCELGEDKEARNYLHNLFGLKGKDFFPERDIDSYVSLSVSDKDKIMFRIAASAIRVRDGVRLKTPDSFKTSGWFNKEEAHEKLKYWKGYTRSFRKIFGKDTFWECLSTTEHSPAGNKLGRLVFDNV
ncbi:MAG: hypothetical protein ABH867_04300 [Patescibacteria group bacterium]|nr:hypothetical protein [Patescibacteria group bacterium]